MQSATQTTQSTRNTTHRESEREVLLMLIRPHTQVVCSLQRLQSSGVSPLRSSTRVTWHACTRRARTTRHSTTIAHVISCGEISCGMHAQGAHAHGRGRHTSLLCTGRADELGRRSYRDRHLLRRDRHLPRSRRRAVGLNIRLHLGCNACCQSVSLKPMHGLHLGSGYR